MKWREKWEVTTGVDSKALKGSLSHYREVCEILRTTSSLYRRRVPVPVLSRVIWGWLGYIADVQ